MPMIYDLSNEYGGKIISDSDSAGAALEVQSGVAGNNALVVGKTGISAVTVAPLHVNHPSAASAVVLSFGGGFISVTSILGIGATGAALGFDFVLPVKLGSGLIRGIPLTSLVSLGGAAAF